MSERLRERVQRWVRPEIRALSAYHVPDPGAMVKLDAMENPYTWPEAMVGEWLELLREVSLNRYPDPAGRALTARLRESLDIPDDMAVMLGNGSDEIIQIVALALAGSGRAVLAPEPGFVMYRMIATFAGMDYVGIPLQEGDFALDVDAMLAAIERHQPAVVFLAYPNNPTGNLFDAAGVDAVIKAAPGLVVVDEAYTAFAEASFMDRLGRHDNLVVMRTLSKIGLAGLRLGLLAGPPEWLGEFDKIRLPYNINVLTQASAEFALRHGAVLDEQTRCIREDRAALFAALAALPGVTAYPSRANFILIRVGPGQAGPVFEGLKAAGVLIKKLDGGHPLLADCLRVTVGAPEENRALLDALAPLLG